MSVELLALMDGGNGSITFTDSSGNGVSLSRSSVNVVQSTTQVKYGVSSGHTDGTINDRVTGTVGTPPGTGDFTAETWVYLVSGGSYHSIFGLGAEASGHHYLVYTDNTSGRLTVNSSTDGLDGSSASAIIQEGSALSAGSWHHIALEVVSGTAYLLRDGSVIGSSGSTVNISSGAVSLFGTSIGLPSLNGYLDEFRYLTAGNMYNGSSYTVPIPYAPNSGAFTSDGVGAFSAAAVGAFISVLTSNGVGTLSGVGSATAVGDLAANGVGAAAFDGVGAKLASLSASGIGAFSPVGSAIYSIGAFTSAGIGAFSGVGKAFANGDFSSAGIGSASFGATRLSSGVLSSLGAATSTFGASALASGVFTSTGTSEFLGATAFVRLNGKIYAINTATLGLSEYGGSFVNRLTNLCEAGGSLLATDATDLFEQIGTTDDSANIDAYILTGKLDFGDSSVVKQFNRLWLTLSGVDDVEVTFYPSSWEGQETKGAYDASAIAVPVSSSEPYERIVRGLIGQGGHFWQVKVANKAGGALNIESLKALIEMTRVLV